MRFETKILPILFMIMIIPCGGELMGQSIANRNNNLKLQSNKIKLKNDVYHQFGISLRSRSLNLNYKKSLKNKIFLRASLGLPSISFRSFNLYGASIRNLSAAIGLERSLIDHDWFRLYAGAETRVNLDYGGGRYFLNYFVNTIAGFAVKLSESLHVFVEMQPGLQWRFRDTTGEIFASSFRSNNIGLMMLL